MALNNNYIRLIEKLKLDFPELTFRQGRRFCFRAPRTVHFAPITGAESEQNYYMLQILHEVGHGELHHTDYHLDVERIKMERAAWEEAKKLAARYKEEFGVSYDEEFVESEMDTYRNWLHTRSKCKKCGLTRYQRHDGKYICPECDLGR